MTGRTAILGLAAGAALGAGWGAGLALLYLAALRASLARWPRLGAAALVATGLARTLPVAAALAAPLLVAGPASALAAVLGFAAARTLAVAAWDRGGVGHR